MLIYADVGEFSLEYLWSVWAGYSSTDLGWVDVNEFLCLLDMHLFKYALMNRGMCA